MVAIVRLIVMKQLWNAHRYIQKLSESEASEIIVNREHIGKETRGWQYEGCMFSRPGMRRRPLGNN